MEGYTVFAPSGLPEISPGDNLARHLVELLAQTPPVENDIVVLAHKIVSKAEGCVVDLTQVHPGKQAILYGRILEKEPALVQVILDESCEVLWLEPGGFILCRHHLGFVCANAAVDASNCAPHRAVTLPRDPDRSAQLLRGALERAFGVRLGVLICDTHGRPFKTGACGTAVGSSGVLLEQSYIGRPDRAGRIMRTSVECYGDEIAAAATLAMGQGDEGRPVAIIRGLQSAIGEGRVSDTIRAPEKDVFLQALREESHGKQL